ncbi:MAG: hypothetical protein IPH11_12895 [Ignavibacteriales bacterium]|nr:hypothetical protein [Ignavibacteriales bacterium]
MLKVKGFTNISFIGQGTDKTILEGIDVSEAENISEWSLWCFDILNSPNITVKNLQIRRFRRWGIRVGSTSNNFLGYNLYIDSCGWTSQIGEVMLSPCAVKLFGDNGHIGQTQIMNSGWDGMQVGGYYVLVDSKYYLLDRKRRSWRNTSGDGIHVFHNPDITFTVDNVILKKAGRLIVRDCVIDTVEAKKSGIEAGYLGEETEKPMIQVYDSYITGGKGIGVTQNANPVGGAFYSTIENSTIVNLEVNRYPLRIENWDAGTPGKIKNNIFLCQANYSKNCPVGECNTIPNSVTYENNRWKKGDDWQLIFCSEQIPNCTSEED